MGIRAAWQALRGGERKESAAAVVYAQAAAGRAAPRMERFDQFADEGYQRNVIAYRAISEIASAAAHVPLLLYAGDDELPADHVVMQRLRRPNPLQGYDAWISAVVSYYLIAGNAYIEAVGPDRGPPLELYALRPDRMTIIPGSSGIPMAYRYEVGGRKTDFPVNPLTGDSVVRHLKTFHPLDDWYGMSPIRAAAMGINQFNQSGEWNQNLLLRGGSRGSVLEMQSQEGRYEVMSDDDFEAIQKRLEEQFGGAKNAGRPKVIEGGFKWVDASFSPQDMDWINGKHTSARDICSAFGFPCQLLGIPGDNTYSNYKEARQALYENTVMPLVGRIVSELNAWLLPKFGEGLELKPDEDQVLGLAPRRESLWDRVSTADFLTPAEKREAVGYGRHEPTGDPQDDLYQSAAVLPLGFESDVSEPGAKAAAEQLFERKLAAAGVPAEMVAELKRLGYGRPNGEWREAGNG